MTIVDHVFQTQVTPYYCGPAAVRVALTAVNQFIGQGQLAADLGTTLAGTDSSEDVARVLNTRLSGRRYGTRYIPGPTPTPVEAAQVWSDVITTIDAGYALVANVAGKIRTQDGTSYNYPGGHYVAITGYDRNDGTVFVSDVAVREYWTGALDLAGWIATRGYAYPLPNGDTMNQTQSDQFDDLIWRIDAINGMHETIQGGRYAGEPCQFVIEFNKLAAAGGTGGASAAQVADEIADRLQS